MPNSQNKSNPVVLTTVQKALEVNLNDNKYGTIVEIGAGQEVARHFFKAGAAAGTVAKTMSAYDMAVSDDIYGKAGRYVSRERLDQMLNTEYDLCIKRLQDVRENQCAFFSYAATVTALRYGGGNECHGWVGLQFQQYARAKPSRIMLHVRMRDNTNAAQAEALGVFGVNLIHAALTKTNSTTELIESLADNLNQGQIEVDLIEFSGTGYENIDNRLMNLHLVRAWLTRAVMFTKDGVSTVPRDLVRKKPVMILRGSFKPPTTVHVDMANSGINQFSNSHDFNKESIVQLVEISMSQLMTSDNTLDDKDFLARVDLVTSLGYNVLLSDYVRLFSLRSWIRQHTNNSIAIMLKVTDLNFLFDYAAYDGLEGRILEGLGKLFADDTSVYVYPAIRDGVLHTLDNYEAGPKNQFLLKQLIANNKLIASTECNPSTLAVSARSTLKKIQSGAPDWQDGLPKSIAEKIKEQKLFGYKGE